MFIPMSEWKNEFIAIFIGKIYNDNFLQVVNDFQIPQEWASE